MSTKKNTKMQEKSIFLLNFEQVHKNGNGSGLFTNKRRPFQHREFALQVF
jgi:hypothetical protein